MGKKMKNALAGIGLTAGVLTVAVGLYARFVKKQSLTSLTVNNYLEGQNAKEKVEGMLQDHPEESVHKLFDSNRQQVKNPFAPIFKNHKEYLYKGMQTFVWNENNDDQDILLYFHGGGFAFPPLDVNYLTVDRIARSTQAKVVLPLYPRTPEYNFKDAFPLLKDLYEEILKQKGEGAKLFLMGDSAGGGLALGFTYYLIDEGIRQPDHTVLVSPWLDLSNSHPNLDETLALEPFYGINSLSTAGMFWAGDKENLIHPYTSPKFGEVDQLKGPFTIFTGTHEAFYYDICGLVEDLDQAGVPYDFEIGQRQLHIYPFYPTLEGIKARNRIINNLKNT